MNDSNSSGSPDTVSLIAMLCAAGAALPAFIPVVRDKAVAWLLSYDVLVPASRAVVEIPTTGAGVDLRRILILAFTLLLVGLIQQMSTRTGRKAKR